LGRKQATAQGAVDRHSKLELTSHEVNTNFLASEQVKLLIWLDQLIGEQGPGRTRHRGLSKQGAQH
jgi:hypothetical protein